MMRVTGLLAPLALAIFGASCAPSERGRSAPAPEGSPIAFRITSAAFEPGQPIPARHTCDGENLSPPLQWSGVPASAVTLALVCDDPDAPAGTWVHWVLYGLRPSETGLAEGVAASEMLPGGARQGRNDFHSLGYGGPCPPRGKPHRYFFRLYALDAALDLAPGATRQELSGAVAGHVVAQGELMGTYQRR